MASNSASKKVYPSGNKQGYTLKVNFSESSSSIDDNTSTIKITGNIISDNISYESYNSNYYAIYWVDDNEHKSPVQITKQTLANVSANKTYTISGTITVKHKSDGTLKGKARIYYYSSGGTYAPPTTTLDTPETTLTTIPRATNCPSGTFYIGQSYSLKLSPASASFTHRLEFKIGTKSFSLTGTDVINLDLNDSTLYSLFSESTYTATATLYTLSETTTIGSKTGAIIIACDKNLCKPTLTATYKDTNSQIVALTGSNQKILKNKSTLEISIKATAKNNSSIDYITVDGNKISSLTSYTTNSPNKTTYVLKAFDKRGFDSEPFTLTISQLIDYVNLSCSANIHRNTPVDGKVVIDYSGNFFNGSFGSKTNALTVKYQYKEHSATSWNTLTTLTPTKTGNTFKQKIVVGNEGTFDYKKLWDFRLIVNDILDTLPPLEKRIARGEPDF